MNQSTHWNELYITDKTGFMGWMTSASVLSTDGAIREMERHISEAKSGNPSYKFLDAESAQIILNGLPFEKPKMTANDLALLDELGI